MNRGNAYHPGEVAGSGIMRAKIASLIDDLFTGPLAILSMAVGEENHGHLVVVSRRHFGPLSWRVRILDEPVIAEVEFPISVEQKVFVR